MTHAAVELGSDLHRPARRAEAVERGAELVGRVDAHALAEVLAEARA